VQASDHAFAATGVAVAAFLDWPHAAVVTQLTYAPGSEGAVLRRELEGGVLHEMQIETPAVITIQLGINTPRYASLRAIKQAAAKPIEVLTPQELGVPMSEVGEAGSASRVRRMYVPEKGRAQLLEGSVEEQAARLAQLIKESTGGAA
jgi:electron transfer flavoprotein beta subunit